MPGRPTILITVGQGPTALAVGAGGGCLDIFTLIYPFSSLSPSLWETARYRLKYCLKGPLDPKQPTNQPIFQGIRHYPFEKNVEVLLVYIIIVFLGAEFSLTEPVPLQAVYIDHSRNPRLLYEHMTVDSKSSSALAVDFF